MRAQMVFQGNRVPKTIPVCITLSFNAEAFRQDNCFLRTTALKTKAIPRCFQGKRLKCSLKTFLPPNKLFPNTTRVDASLGSTSTSELKADVKVMREHLASGDESQFGFGVVFADVNQSP